jgi:dipeptide/tripeptide permease
MLAGAALAFDSRSDTMIAIALANVYFGIGLFVASSYALFMDLTDPRLGGTQFTAFMAATNGCEAWSGLAMGAMAGAWGYPYGMFVLAGVSAAALGIVPFLKRAPDRHETADASQTHQA